MSYDKKFREKVLNHVEKGHSQEETRKLFGIGRNTIRSWKKLEEETGNLSKRELNRSWRKIDPEKLKADVESNPSDFNAERAKRFGCSEDGRRALKRNDLTRKKRQ